MQIMMILQSMLVLNVITRYGNADDIAFYGMVIRLFGFVVQPLAGFMIAMPPVIGVNFGAAQPERVVVFFKRFLTAAFIIVLPFWIFMLTFPQTAASVMISSAQITAENILQVRLYVPVMLILPLFTGVRGVYYGTLLIELATGLPMLILIKREFKLLRTGVTKWTENGGADYPRR